MVAVCCVSEYYYECMHVGFLFGGFFRLIIMSLLRYVQYCNSICDSEFSW